MSQPHTFYRFAFPRKSFALRNGPFCLPLPRNSNAHPVPFFSNTSLRRLAVCVLTLVSWFGTRCRIRISVCLGICLWVPSCPICISALTLLWRFSSYSAYAFQVLLCCGFSVLTQLMRFRSYFAVAFRFLLGLCVSGLTLLWHFGSYSAYAFQVLLCCGISVLTQPTRFRSYFAVAFQVLLGLHVSDLTLPDSWDRTFRKGSLMV